MNNTVGIKVKSFKWMIDNAEYNENLECFERGYNRYVFDKDDLQYCGLTFEAIKNGSQYMILDNILLPDWAVEVISELNYE